MHLSAYIRVSKSRDGGLSPDEQRDKIKKYAELHDIRLTWHEDETDVSGGKMARPIFDAVKAEVLAGTTDGIIVAKLDRFARTLVGGVEAIAELTKAGKVLVSVIDGIDFSTPTGRAMGHIMIAFAELERERLKEAFANGQRSKIDRGIHAADAPYGYRKVNGQPLTVNADEAPHVRTMFRLRADGWSPGRIAKRMNDEAPLASGRQWIGRRVSGILTNRAYLGEARYGVLRNRNAHEAIITIDEFDAAQVVKGGRNALKGEQGLLTGIIRCAGCRYVMRPRHETRGEKIIPGYVCAKHHGSGTCPSPTAIAAHLIDPLVMEHLLVVSREGEDDGADLADARRELQLAEDRKATLIKAIPELSASLGMAALLEQAERLGADVDAAQAAVDKVLATRQRPPHATASLGEVDPRDVVRSSLNSVYVRGGREPVAERVMVFQRGDDVLDKPKRGGSDYVLTPVPWDKTRTLTPMTVEFVSEDHMDALEAAQTPDLLSRFT